MICTVSAMKVQLRREDQTPTENINLKDLNDRNEMKKITFQVDERKEQSIGCL